jgi:hypothetical protein
MLRRVFLFILIGGSLLLSSCALLPYSENFACEKGKTSGYCGSVSEVYKTVNDGGLK